MDWLITKKEDFQLHLDPDQYYTCPLCPGWRMRGKYSACSHIDYRHWKKAIPFKDQYIVRCWRPVCRSDRNTLGHYHCPICGNTYLKRQKITYHLQRFHLNWELAVKTLACLEDTLENIFLTKYASTMDVSYPSIQLMFGLYQEMKQLIKANLDMRQVRLLDHPGLSMCARPTHFQKNCLYCWIRYILLTRPWGVKSDVPEDTGLLGVSLIDQSLDGNMLEDGDDDRGHDNDDDDDDDLHDVLSAALPDEGFPRHDKSMSLAAHIERIQNVLKKETDGKVIEEVKDPAPTLAEPEVNAQSDAPEESMCEQRSNSRPGSRGSGKRKPSFSSRYALPEKMPNIALSNAQNMMNNSEEVDSGQRVQQQSVSLSSPCLPYMPSLHGQTPGNRESLTSWTVEPVCKPVSPTANGTAPLAQSMLPTSLVMSPYTVAPPAHSNHNGLESALNRSRRTLQYKNGFDVQDLRSSTDQDIYTEAMSAAQQSLFLNASSRAAQNGLNVDTAEIPTAPAGLLYSQAYAAMSPINCSTNAFQSNQSSKLLLGINQKQEQVLSKVCHTASIDGAVQEMNKKFDVLIEESKQQTALLHQVVELLQTSSTRNHLHEDAMEDPIIIESKYNGHRN